MPQKRLILLNAEGWGVEQNLNLEPTSIHKQIREQLGLEVFLLHDGGLIVGQSSQPVVVEVLSGLPHSLGELGYFEIPQVFRPWQRAGWLARAASWWGQPVNLIEMVSTYDLACVLKTDGSYFKAGESREALITQAIAREHPDLTPTVLAVDPQQGWLVTSDCGARLTEGHDLELWLSSVQKLAGFQRNSSSSVLLNLGCPTFSHANFPKQFSTFVQDALSLNHWGLSETSIAQLQQGLAQVLTSHQAIVQLGLNETPVHGDAQPMNALEGLGSVWFDWSEAAIAHPFTDIGWLLAWLSRKSNLPIYKNYPDILERLWAEYLRAVGLSGATALMRPTMIMAMAHRAWVYQQKFSSWQGTLEGWRPQYVPYYLRQLLRLLEG